MNIWRISGNSNYKSCILIDNNNKQIYDPAFYFKEKQEDLSFKRKIKFIDIDCSFADISNYFGTSGTFVINDKTKKIFETHFNHIQFFPLICDQYPEKTFWLLNVYNYHDVLDISHCKYDTILNRKGNRVITHIDSYAFKNEVLNLDIFKIILNGKKYTIDLFVTDTFKDIMEQNNITGLRLKKVYEI